MPTATNLNFKTLFEQTPGSYVVFTPDFTIVAFSNAYLNITNTSSELIIGKKLHEVFPDNPDDASSSIEFIRASVNKTIERGEPYTGGIVKYDIRGINGEFEKRYWRTLFVPVRNDKNIIAWIIARAEDVTEIAVLNEEKLKWMEKFSQNMLLTDELRLLSGHLQTAREKERANIAKEVHDDVGQQMMAMKMDLSWLIKKINSSDQDICSRMDNVMHLLTQTIKSVRRICTDLRPSLLDDMGLVAAIEWQLLEFEKKWKIKTHFAGLSEDPSLEDSVKTSIFRIFQESLINVARHAKAQHIWLSLKQKQDQLILTIKDDGVGFKQDALKKKTFGLISMKERTMMMGGKYEINSTPEKGTTITLTMPVNIHSKDFSKS